MRRYSNIVKPSCMASMLMLILLTVIIAAQNFTMCNFEEHDLTSQNQYLNTDYLASEATIAHHSLAMANPATSDEDIIDYNDTYKVYKLFNTAHIHTANDCLEVKLNSSELKCLNSFSNNSSPHEKTILLHSILI